MKIGARGARLSVAIALGTALGVAGALSGQTIDKIKDSEALVGVRGVQVPPIPRSDVANMVDVGTIDAEGFTHLTLNLAGELKGALGQRGEVVAVLIPEIPPFTTAHRTLGLLPSSFELTAPLSAYGGFYFMAKQVSMEVGFPRYRVLLYNTSTSTATVAFFAYRTKR